MVISVLHSLSLRNLQPIYLNRSLIIWSRLLYSSSNVNITNRWSHPKPTVYSVIQLTILTSPTNFYDSIQIMPSLKCEYKHHAICSWLTAPQVSVSSKLGTHHSSENWKPPPFPGNYFEILTPFHGKTGGFQTLKWPPICGKIRGFQTEKTPFHEKTWGLMS